MRWPCRTFSVFFIIMIAGCSLAPFSSPIFRKDTEKTEESIFQNAERAFDEKHYSEALEGYNTFLQQRYNERLADRALYKIGKIYRIKGLDEDALAVFTRLTREFPSSPIASDGMREALAILFEKGRFDAVASQGLAFTEVAKAASLSASVFLLIADAQTALGADLEAARFYYRAWNAASDNEAQSAWRKLKGAVEKLDSDEIQQLITLVADRPVMGFLLYRLGMAYIVEEKFDDAQGVLKSFVEQFPDNAAHQDALDLIQSLGQRSHYAPFTIGCLLPLSGSYALFGRQALDGIEFAVSRLNQPESGVSVKLVVKDTHSNADMAAKGVAELDQEKVAAILGPMTTSERAASVAQERGIPIVVFTQREGVTDRGDFVFRNFITPQMQVQALVGVAVERLGARRFAILYPNENYGKRYMDLFWDQVTRSGGAVNGVEAYDPGITDFSQPIRKLANIYFGHANKESNAPSVAGGADQHELSATTMGFDAIFIPDAPKKVAMIIPQMAYYDIRGVYLLGTNLWHDPELIAMSGDYMKQAVIVDGFSAENPSPTVTDFVSGFQHVYARAPGIIEAMAYDSAMMVFYAMRQAGANSREALRASLMQIQNFDGVTGRTHFAPSGDAVKALQLLRIEGGQFVHLSPALVGDETSATTLINH